MPKTKIVCTLGPSTDSEDTLRRILRAGARVFRLNFSHDTHEQQAWRARTVRKLAEEEGLFVAIMADLQGPKLRIGEIASGPVVLEEGAPLVLTARPAPGTEEAVHFGQREVIHDLCPGDRILLDDGLLELRVQRVDGDDALTQVVVGGELSSRKGVSLPDTTLRLGSLTPKDHEDARFAVSLGVDYFALSFVRCAANLHDLRTFLEDRDGGGIPIIAKIEKREALDRFEEILEASDGIMVARGDLGVETPPEDVPIHQKAIVKRCNAVGRPVIIATQMLQSMMDNPRPTRAEASDVANAILDGADAVMVSGETAVGRYPVGAVETMVRIARSTEAHFPHSTRLYQSGLERSLTVTDAISQATCEIAAELGAKAIVTSTRSGYTARMVAKYRPATPILASTPDPKVAARLSLVWGVEPIQVEQFESTDEMIERAMEAAKAGGVVCAGDLSVITAGVPIGGPGRTNMLKVHAVE
jgi:pyruvate kinase